ncbi:hypothetical protein [Nisaea sediminum]|uniref:hypothetical protein n=1 Tax=Nisaea sediminum TaxID=2775867 RepID=UPI001865B61E|nr:hypothetical protein [Nisaea sediminum]
MATAASKDEGQAEALKVMSRAGTEGVRVIKDTGKSIHDLKPEDILFEKLKPKGEEKVFIQNIDDAPLCYELSDFYEGEGRQTINRLFRAYLDKHNITASEALHSARELKRLLDDGTLLFSAVAKVATFQAAKLEDTNANERRETLFAFVDHINAAAQKTLQRPMPRIRDAGFNEAIAEIKASIKEGEDRGYLIRSAITTELVENRSYLGKLAQCIDWAVMCEDPDALLDLDIFISDILQNAEVLKDMLGHQRDTGSALVTMICFAGGEPLGEEPENLTPEHPDYTNIQLNKLIGAGKLPESQEVLVDRVRRQLEGIGPLSKGDREEEREVFHGLLHKLIPDCNMVGGPNMAEAVTARQSTIINKGGQKGMKEAAASMLPALADPARKAAYLLSLLESKLGKDLLRSDIDTHLDAMFVSTPSLNHLVREKLPPNKKMAKVTQIFHKIQESSLPEPRKEELTSRIDDLLASYIVDGKILDKIDGSDKPLHIKAFMLVSMVQPEMLPKGKASNLARQIIVNHLKRPNFEAELVSQIPDPQDQANTLRRFHEQLHRCGFFG